MRNGLPASKVSPILQGTGFADQVASLGLEQDSLGHYRRGKPTIRDLISLPLPLTAHNHCSEWRLNKWRAVWRAPNYQPALMATGPPSPCDLGWGGRWDNKHSMWRRQAWQSLQRLNGNHRMKNSFWVIDLQSRYRAPPRRVISQGIIKFLVSRCFPLGRVIGVIQPNFPEPHVRGPCPLPETRYLAVLSIFGKICHSRCQHWQ